MESLYKHKKQKERILSGISLCSLRLIKSFGQSTIDGWDNSLILGDNLVALRALLEEPCVAGNVKLVYIDPPFATNQQFRIGTNRTATVSWSQDDERAYDDKLVGAEFLEFLRARLLLLYDILANDGSIYVHIDCTMGHYLKILMDETFGPERFINDITRIKCNPKNFDRKAYGNVKDMILFYSKTQDYVWNDPRETMNERQINNLFSKMDGHGRRYTTTPIHAPGETRNGPTGKPWKGLNPPKGRHWRYDPDELTRLDQEGLIEWSPSGNPRKKIYADEVRAKGKKLQDIWEFKDPPYPSYPTEKNLHLLKRIIKASSNTNDLVLDCFVGSGTTLIAAGELGRRWIGIDNSSQAIEASKKRLSRTRHCPAYSLYELNMRSTTKDEAADERVGSQEYRVR